MTNPLAVLTFPKFWTHALTRLETVEFTYTQMLESKPS
jgi:hypothetical protein